MSPHLFCIYLAHFISLPDVKFIAYTVSLKYMLLMNVAFECLLMHFHPVFHV